VLRDLEQAVFHIRFAACLAGDRCRSSRSHPHLSGTGRRQGDRCGTVPRIPSPGVPLDPTIGPWRISRSLRPGLLELQHHRLRAVASTRPGGFAGPFANSECPLVLTRGLPSPRRGR
jgi:hypothetical protein